MSPEAGLLLLRAQHLRCLDAIELIADPAQNIIVGKNGAGKTSILEAIYYLGRGKSFRPGLASMLIQYDQEEFNIFGEVAKPPGRHRLGISHGREGRQVHFDAQSQATLADLVAALPVQIIDPEVHQLIQGGPKGRREFIDWGVFHVKHDFLGAWRRYRRALKQRNAALKQGMAKQSVMAWDPELIESGLVIDAARKEYVSAYMPLMSSISSELLLNEVICCYQSGWANAGSFAEALSASWDRDCNNGATQVGPHRGELLIQSDGQPARNRLSRGQQKLLSIALVLAQSIFVARSQQRKVTLLVDEPAAELDSAHVHKLIEILSCEELQLFISTLDLDALPVNDTARVFHVERGALSTLI